MAGSAVDQPLSTEAAKERLRNAAESVSIGGWVRRNPIEALAAGLLGGLLLARLPRIRRSVSKGILRFFLRGG